MSRKCHSLTDGFCTRTGLRERLREQIVAAAPEDGALNKFSDRGRLSEDDRRVHVRRVPFGPREKRLIDEQFQLAANALLGHFARDPLLQ